MSTQKIDIREFVAKNVPNECFRQPLVDFIQKEYSGAGIGVIWHDYILTVPSGYSFTGEFRKPLEDEVFICNVGSVFDKPINSPRFILKKERVLLGFEIVLQDIRIPLPGEYYILPRWNPDTLEIEVDESFKEFGLTIHKAKDRGYVEPRQIVLLREKYSE